MRSKRKINCPSLGAVVPSLKITYLLITPRCPRFVCDFSSILMVKAVLLAMIWLLPEHGARNTRERGTAKAG